MQVGGGNGHQNSPIMAPGSNMQQQQQQQLQQQQASPLMGGAMGVTGLINGGAVSSASSGYQSCMSIQSPIMPPTPTYQQQQQQPQLKQQHSMSGGYGSQPPTPNSQHLYNTNIHSPFHQSPYQVLHLNSQLSLYIVMCYYS